MSTRKRPLSIKLKTKVSKKAKYENEKPTSIDQGASFLVNIDHIKEEQKFNDENDEQMV